MCVCIFMYESKGVRRRNGRSMQSMTHAKTGNISINILTVTLIIAILLHHLHNLSLTPVGAVFINWFYFNPITTDIIHFFLSSFPPPLLFPSFPSFLLSSNRTEYAAVGYIAKRIEMRKKRYQNLQKLAEQRRAAPPPPGWMEGPDGETAPTVAKSHVTILAHPSYFHFALLEAWKRNLCSCS